MNQIYIRGNEIATKAYVDSLSLGGDGSALDNYYTKEEVNNLIEDNDSGSADLSNYYTKEEINNVIAEINNTIQKDEMPNPSEDNVGTIIQYIGDTNEYYTNSHFYQVVEQTIINEDGTETTIYVWEEIVSPEADLSNYYTKEEINNLIADINNSTQIEEMPEASEDNKGTIVQYVGVTNNNYTTGYFYQVIEETIINEDGTKTVIYKWEQIDMPSVDLSDYATKKYVDDTVAGATGTDLSNYYTKEEINNKGYITSSEANSTYVTQNNFNTLEKTIEDKANSSDVYTKEETDKAITDAVADVKTTDFQTATELPTENISTNTIYLIAKEGEDGDIYEEYIYINNKWEKIGETTIDLSKYSTTEEMNAAIAAEIAKINTSNYITKTEVLTKNNTEEFTPDSDYEPATKKYVDEAVANASSSNGVAKESPIIDLKINASLLSGNLSITDKEILKKVSDAFTKYNKGEISLPIFNVIGTLTTLPQLIFIHDSYPTTIPLNGSLRYTGYAVRYSMGDLQSYLTLLSFDISSDDDNNCTVSSMIITNCASGKSLLTPDNTKSYTPTGNYNPATKKYVDDIVGDINSILDAINGEEV